MYRLKFMGFVVMDGEGRDKSAFILLNSSFFSAVSFDLSLFFYTGGFYLYGGNGAKYP